MVMSYLTNSAIFQQIPSLTILLHPTNIIVCIDQNSQQGFAVDSTSTEESTSYAISRPEWLSICNNHSDKLLGNLLISLVEVHNIGGLHEYLHRTIKYIFSALLHLGDILTFSLQVQNTRQKLADITSSIISAVNLRCQCSLTVNHISATHFLCTSDRHVVLYRAELSGHSDCEQVLSHIEQWIGGGQTHIVVQGSSIEVYPNCPIEVDSLPSQIDCVRSTTTDTGSERVGITAVGGGVGGVVLIGIMILTVVVCVCRYKHKQR